MSATFNSFIHPFIIILTVPLAVFGGLVFVLFLNSSINIFSQIALVILIGISTKNSILIVDYTNQIRTTGVKIQDAIIKAIWENIFIELFKNKMKTSPPNTARGTVKIIINGCINELNVAAITK